MFDISWTEFLLIGVVALIVIGPKELPAVMRTFGQYTRKIRSMAADFQGQFQEAMREAEMLDLKKQVDDIAEDFTKLDPLKNVRENVASIGKDLQTSLDLPAAAKPDEPAVAEPTADAADTVAPALPEPGAPLPLMVTSTPEPAAQDAPREPVAAEAARPMAAPTPEPVAAAAPPAAAAEPAGTERSG
jgi:sec-independent protein translocase protein TatB